MLTVPQLTTLLGQATRDDGIPPLLAHLGFHAPQPMDAPTRSAVGIPDEVSDANVARGNGALRAVVLFAGSAPVREVVLRTARRMATKSPHLLWLLVVRSAGGIALAAWSATSTAPTVASLLVDGDRVTVSDAESLGALCAAAHGEDRLVHARWREILGREALSAQFYRALEGSVGALADGLPHATPLAARRELALLAASRLLFLAFLESRGWLDRDRTFLGRIVDHALATGGSVHQRALDPLFFGTLNTRWSRRAPVAKAFGRVPFLNGGLFQRTPLEARWRRLRFTDASIVSLAEEVLFRYRFTSREDDGGWSELAIDPEMLGRAFESLMASDERRTTGTFYTPHVLVERVTEAALRDALASRGVDLSLIDASGHDGGLDAHAATLLGGAVRDLRVLDPACGSGAFLVHALERLSRLSQLSGDQAGETERRARIAAANIFGVDLQPTAVWLCELRLWLSVVLECSCDDPMDLPALPNLDHNVRVGDAIRAPAFDTLGQAGFDASTARLRVRYAASTGWRKHTLLRQLQRSERRRAERVLVATLETLRAQRHDLLAAARGTDLFGQRRGSPGEEADARGLLRAHARACRARLREVRDGRSIPFSFPSHFPDAAAAGGFDVVIGNPPWVRLHRIPDDLRPELKRSYRVFREAAWEQGARDAGAGRGFAAQVDLAALFVERGIGLTRGGGTLALLVPAKLWRSLAGGGVRRLCAEWNRLQLLEDWSDAPATFDAAVYPSLVVVRRVSPEASDGVTLCLHRRDLAISWRAHRNDVVLDESPGAPWLILPPDARSAFDRLARAGVPLAASGLGRPTLGVKSGCNEAFLVRVLDTDRGHAIVTDGTRRGRVESALLRPVVRGDGVRAWRRDSRGDSIVFPHHVTGGVLAELPPGARAWLAPYRTRLLSRSDARGSRTWWSLFRLESAATQRARVVWADVARGPGAVVLLPGDPTVPLNSCYVLACRDVTDAHAFAAWLNSPLAASWLSAIAEPARGSYRRYMAWTVARLPIPRDWARARELLAPLGERASRGERVGPSELVEAAIRAFRVRASMMVELISWEIR